MNASSEEFQYLRHANVKRKIFPRPDFISRQCNFKDSHLNKLRSIFPVEIFANRRLRYRFGVLYFPRDPRNADKLTNKRFVRVAGTSSRPLLTHTSPDRESRKKRIKSFYPREGAIYHAVGRRFQHMRYGTKAPEE